MSVCEDVKERLCEFLDGELAQADRAVVESHLQSCTGCREELSALRAASAAVHTLERRPAPASILAGVRSGLKQQPQTPDLPKEVIRPGPSFWVRRALSVAAVLIVAVLIYVAYIPQHREQRAMSPANGEAKSAAKYAAPTRSPAVQSDAAAQPGVPQPASPKAESLRDSPFAKADSAHDDFDKVRPAEELAEKRAEQKKTAPEATPEPGPAADQDAKIVQPAIPNTPAPVAQGTPPHVIEGGGRSVSKDTVTQKLKQGWDELTGTREAKPEDDFGRRAKEKEEADVGRGEIAKVDDLKTKATATATPAPPAATAMPADSQTVVAQPGQQQGVRSNVNEKIQEVAESRLQKEQLQRKSEAPAPAKPLVSANAKGTDVRDLAAAKIEAKKPTGEIDTLGDRRMARSRMTPSRQVLTVPVKDLNIVVADLRRLATSSGGELAWQPSGPKAGFKKDAGQTQRAMQQPLGTEQAVIRVPQARMEELLRATEQYRAQLLLSMETAKANKKESFALTGKTAKTADQAARQEEEGGVEFVQVVLDIQPQTAPAAAEASNAEPIMERNAERVKDAKQ